MLCISGCSNILSVSMVTLWEAAFFLLLFHLVSTSNAQCNPANRANTYFPNNNPLHLMESLFHKISKLPRHVKYSFNPIWHIFFSTVEKQNTKCSKNWAVQRLDYENKIELFLLTSAVNLFKDDFQQTSCLLVHLYIQQTFSENLFTQHHPRLLGCIHKQNGQIPALAELI